jgi:hypothetical protein
MANGNLPDVVQLMLCQSAAYDELRNAWVLVHPLCQLHVTAYQQDPFPHEILGLAVYFQLTNITQNVNVRVEVSGPANIVGLHTSYKSNVYTVSPPNQGTHMENVIRLPGLAIIDEGLHVFQLLLDGQKSTAGGVVHLMITGEKIP